MLMIVLIFFLHAFNKLLFLDGISEFFEKVNNYHILIDRFTERIIDPSVGFSSDIDEQITGCDLHYIISIWLKAVKIDPVIKKERNLRTCGIITEYIHHPVVLGKDGYDNAQSVISGGCARGR